MGLFGPSKKELKEQISNLQRELNDSQEKFHSLGGNDYLTVKAQTDSLRKDAENLSAQISTQREEKQKLSDESDELTKKVTSQDKRLRKEKELYKAMQHSLESYEQFQPGCAQAYIDSKVLDEAEMLSPTVIANLHAMDSKSLRKAYNENSKQIDKLLSLYSARYTTKANRAIYSLMTIALRAELQNIITNLKYDKLDDAIDKVKATTAKYLKIAGDGNQSIAGTLTKFIGEIEYLFINAVKIEYNYYVKREQAKQEQVMLREQMKQEREERKALEEERKRVEAEETKYQNELEKAKEQMAATQSEDEINALKAKILELENGLTSVASKKDEIANLMKGKAGYVYIISNVGSFGENVFKIGMTSRLDPEERVNELGSASVPFKFDVHSFIFSEDAVGLENALHSKFDDRRVNKVNMRKEFFRVSLDELEAAVNEIDPTADFRRVVPAAEYNASLSSDQSYTSEYQDDEDEDEEEEE